MAAACRAIAQKGLRGLRVEDVAAEAKVATSLIYYHFRDRAGLIAATLEHINRRAGQYPREETAGPSRDGYEEVLARLRRELQDDPEVREQAAVWGEIRGAAVFDPALRRTVAASTSYWIDKLAEAIRSGQGDGSIPVTVHPDDAATRLTAFVEGLGDRWLSGQLDTDEVRRHITEAAAKELEGGVSTPEDMASRGRVN